ncbi:helix-turn-helix transcriptional regulator [Nesterenkonia sp. MY13]|uniref:Helix-turn-helix transcriptional regulator n=1 Tax=Nesterenkonia sedimenti TaxID=1463632 RepID=A0A7X8YEU9_9MICC|nr:helix-turn-helix domain-containing protein [Nesterenkonia sedimenti]NLS10612.1 helix-turn-helix transcriptional regulator [Nesterenkonia sedimenti]
MSEKRTAAERWPENAQIKDAQSLKAFTHPLRRRILDYLSEVEEATSTTLAKHLGESTGQTSYHLRQLAKYGFVQEVEDKGTARERWWKSGGLNMEADDLQSLTQENPQLMQTLAEQQVSYNARKLLEYFRGIGDEDPTWAEVGLTSTTTTTMTSDELLALREELWDVMDRHTDAAKDRREDEGQEGARRVRINMAVFPLPPGDTEDG